MNRLVALTEGPAASRVHEVAARVGSEGTSMLLSVLGGVAALIVVIVLLPMAVRLVRRFVDEAGEEPDDWEQW